MILLHHPEIDMYRSSVKDFGRAKSLESAKEYLKEYCGVARYLVGVENCMPRICRRVQALKPAPTTPAKPASTEALALPYCADPAAIQRYAGFALLYSEPHEQPTWVAYLLTDDEVRGTLARTNNFRASLLVYSLATNVLSRERFFGRPFYLSKG